MGKIFDIGENQFEEIRREYKRVAAFFYHPDYKESEKSLRIFQEIVNEDNSESVYYCKINSERCSPEFIEEFKIPGVPCIVLLIAGSPVYLLSEEETSFLMRKKYVLQRKLIKNSLNTIKNVDLLCKVHLKYLYEAGSQNIIRFEIENVEEEDIYNLKVELCMDKEERDKEILEEIRYLSSGDRIVIERNFMKPFEKPGNKICFISFEYHIGNSFKKLKSRFFLKVHSATILSTLIRNPDITTPPVNAPNGVVIIDTPQIPLSASPEEKLSFLQKEACHTLYLEVEKIENERKENVVKVEKEQTISSVIPEGDLLKIKIPYPEKNNPSLLKIGRGNKEEYGIDIQLIDHIRSKESKEISRRHLEILFYPDRITLNNTCSSSTFTKVNEFTLPWYSEDVIKKFKHSLPGNKAFPLRENEVALPEEGTIYIANVSRFKFKVIKERRNIPSLIIEFDENGICGKVGNEENKGKKYLIIPEKMEGRK